MSDKLTTYNLYLTERRYKNETLGTFHFQANKKIIKNFVPVDIDGERKRLNLSTGEVEFYTRKLVEQSKKASVTRSDILINTLLEMNEFDWFWTLTFDKEKIDRYNDELVTECYEKYVNNISKQYLNFAYMCFPERHKKDNCLHFHLLVKGLSPEDMGLVNSGKVCCSWATDKDGICSKSYFNKTKHLHNLTETDGEPIYNITKFIYGFTTVSKIVSKERCNSYVKKYVKKDLGGSTEINKKRFYYSRNLLKPEVIKKLISNGMYVQGDIANLDVVKNNILVKNSTGLCVKEHNIAQFKIENNIKDFIDKGYIPLSEEEIKNLELDVDSLLF